MKKITRYAIFMMLLFASANLYAQYSVITTKGTYADLANPTIVGSGATLSADFMFSMPGNVSAPFWGKSYATSNMNATPAPDLLFGAGTNTSTQAEIFAFINLDGQGIDNNSSFSYQVDGDSKTGTLKFQWKNIGIQNSSSSTDYLNLQVWLYLADSSFSIIMGPNQITGKSVFGSEGGPTVAVIQWDQAFDYLAVNALQGDPASPTISTKVPQGSDPLPILSGVPASGTTYHFKNAAQSTQHTHTAGIETVEVQKPTLSIYPNPLNGPCHISYTVPEASSVAICLTDMNGKQIKNIESGTKVAGSYQTTIETAGLKPGVYFCKLTEGEFLSFSKFVVIR